MATLSCVFSWNRSWIDNRQQRGNNNKTATFAAIAETDRGAESTGVALERYRIRRILHLLEKYSVQAVIARSDSDAAIF
jgi:hypothetical protein